jgi:hypothetical protein
MSSSIPGALYANAGAPLSGSISGSKHTPLSICGTALSESGHPPNGRGPGVTRWHEGVALTCSVLGSGLFGCAGFRAVAVRGVGEAKRHRWACGYCEGVPVSRKRTTSETTWLRAMAIDLPSGEN